jgi:hypothetical protein
MSVHATVTITFDADDEAAAHAIVEAWQLHESAQVALTMTTTRTGTADAGGAVALALPSFVLPPFPSPPTEILPPPPTEILPPPVELPPPVA